MRNNTAKGLRYLAKKEICADTEYLKQTFHHVYTGKDAKGEKMFMEVTDPIKLAVCTREVYKRRKNDYKANNKR